MTAPEQFKPADYGDDHNELVDQGKIRRIEINWLKPSEWRREESAPLPERQQRPGFLYALSYDHHRANRRESIGYVGVSEKLDTRFAGHPCAAELLAHKRKAFLTVGDVDFGRLRFPSDKTRRVIEEIEHILIWALYARQPLLNVRKVMSLPAFGKRGGKAWHIINTGYRFRGQMPREILYPWMLVRPGRDRCLRP